MQAPNSASPQAIEAADEPPDFKSIEHCIHEKIGQNLRIVRNQLGKTQADAARLAGVSLSQYRRYEEYRDLPTLSSALNWSIETGMPTHWLFTGTGYDAFVDVDIKPAWIPIMHFINRAPSAALASFQSAVEGLTGKEMRAPLKSYTDPCLHECRRNIHEDYFPAMSERLRAFRQSTALSQDAIAAALGVSTAAYKRYEVPGRINRFGINLIMRFWVATKISPLELTSHSRVYAYRQRQNANFAALLPLLRSLQPHQIEQAKALAATLGGMFAERSDCTQSAPCQWV